MTAEIVIANKSAVALAADSAVTVGSQKIYNGAIKLFALSKVEPVGVMIYGNANLMSMPWETIIKEFRSDLGNSAFPKISDYSEHLIKHIESTKYFSDEEQNQHVKNAATFLYKDIHNEASKYVDENIHDKGDVSEVKTLEIYKSCVQSRYNQLKPTSLADRYTKKYEQLIRKKYSPIFKKVYEEIFAHVKLSNAIRGMLYDIVTFALTRKGINSNELTGVVIAGFGVDEHCPVIHTCHIDGVIQDKVKSAWIEQQSNDLLTGAANAVIIPFAQQEMVHTFMRGMDPKLEEFQDEKISYFHDMLSESLDFGDLKLSKSTKLNLRSMLSEQIKSLWQDIEKDILNFRQQNNVTPVLSMVSALPKDELAAMAEMLVSLTAFKRRITGDLETVGGPIDVAVISKGDGLVWVKRKHYFPRDLNNHFFHNYFREVKR